MAKGFIVCTHELHTGKRIQLMGFYPMSRRQKIAAERAVEFMGFAGLPAWVEEETE